MAFDRGLKNLYRKSYQKGTTLGIYRLRTGEYMSEIFNGRGFNPYKSSTRDIQYYKPNTSLKKIITESNKRLIAKGDSIKKFKDSF